MVLGTAIRGGGGTKGKIKINFMRLGSNYSYYKHLDNRNGLFVNSYTEPLEKDRASPASMSCASPSHIVSTDYRGPCEFTLHSCESPAFSNRNRRRRKMIVVIS